MPATGVSRARLLAPVLLIAWFAALALSYHRGFPPGTIFPHALSIAAAALIFAGAAAAGGVILDRLAPERVPAPLSWVLATGLGLGAIELFMFSLFAARLARPAAAWILAAALAVLIVSRIPTWRREGAAAAALWRATATRHWIHAGGVVAGVGIGAALLAALGPAEFYDALIYHLAVPARWIAAGGFVSIEGNFYASFPANQSMLYAFGMLLSGDPIRAGSLAQILHWGCGVTGIAATYAAGARHLGPKVGWLAAVLLATVPGILLTSTWPIADLGVMLYGSLVTVSLLEAGASDVPGARKRWMILAGAFAGLALGVKYTAVLTVLVPGVSLCLFLAWRSRGAAWPPPGANRGAHRVAETAIFALTAGALFAPWALKNVVLAGNPFAPYLGGIFGAATPARSLTEELTRQLPAGSDPMDALLHYLGAPWRAGVTRLGAGGYVGVTFALLIPFLLLRRKQPGAVAALAVYAGAGVAAWSGGVPLSRYLFPVLPAAALLAAQGALCLVRAAPLAYEGLACILAWLAGHGVYLFGVLALTIDPFGAALGTEPVEDYLGRRVGYYRAAEHVNANLPAGARLLLVGEGRGYYLERAYEASTPFDRILLERFADSAAREGGRLAKILRDAGFTHLLTSRGEMDRVARMAGREEYFGRSDPAARAAIDALFTEGELKSVFEGVGVTVFEIAGAIPTASPPNRL